MNHTGAARPSVPETPQSPIDRLLAFLGRRRSPELLVWVNTTRGQHAVPLSRLKKTPR